MNVVEALDHVVDMGLIVTGLDCDGVLHRVAVDGKRSGNKSGAYCLRELLLRSGRSVVVGFAQNWSTGDQRSFSVADGDDFDAKDMDEAKKLQAEMRKKAEKEQQEKSSEAAKRAEEIWGGLPESGKAPYLFNKGVRGYGLRYARDAVVVPLKDVDGNWRGLQFINADGSKRFITGTAKKGAFHLIGVIDKGVAIAEGYATAATIHEAMSWPVVVAFDAGNLLPVATAIREKFPDIHIVVCGDDDHETVGNPGRTKALSAVGELKKMKGTGRVNAVFPVFKERA